MTIFVLAATVICSSGCVSVSANLMRMIYGDDIQPEYKGLKDQKIVIVCGDEAGYGRSDVSEQVATNLQTMVGNKLRKADVVRQSDIDPYLADVTDPKDLASELGTTLEADYVITVDVRNLKLRDGATLYRGTADLSLEIYSVTEDRVVFRKSMVDYTYPQTAAISQTETTEHHFQRMYLAMVADKLSHLLIPYPRGSDIASDARILGM